MTKSTSQYFESFEKDYIHVFRKSNTDVFELSILGLTKFIDGNDIVFMNLIEMLRLNGFLIKFKEDTDSIESVKVECTNITSVKTLDSFNFQITNLLSLIEESSQTNIPLIGIVIMRIVAKLISKYKILYKAIVLDLDDTLWPGTLSEDGIEKIKKNLHSKEAVSYIAFMRFVSAMAKELGIFVAICSRNDEAEVKSAISVLDDDIFPIKNQIDCIVANSNDKSYNIKLISQELSILTSSIVLIDDNQLIREEVKKSLQEVFVPIWDNHYELITQLIVSCVFERFELSINSRNRKKQYKILQAEKKSNSLPQLFIKVSNDEDHIQAKKLYSKSNQFKLVSDQIDYSNTKSLYFELFKSNEENLGICSAITYSEAKDSVCGILNWAISCRYFEIGLEEFIVYYLKKLMAYKKLYFVCQFNKENQKTMEFIEKYYGTSIFDSCDSVPSDSDLFINHYKTNKCFARLLMNLKKNSSRFNVYWIESCSTETNLKLL